MSLQSLYGFNDIRITKAEEIGELNYIPYIKDSLIKTATVSYYSSKGDCNKVKADINSTEKFLEEEMIKNGIKLTTFYTTSCPSPQIYFNFTLKSQEFYSKIEFVDELYCDGVLCLKFDEGYGTRTRDSSIYNNDGFLGNGSAWSIPIWVEGKYGKALNFNGSQFVNVSGSSSLSPTKITIEAWIKPNGPVCVGPNCYDQAIVIKGDDVYTFAVDKFNNLSFGRRVDTTTNKYNESDFKIIWGTWQHVAVSYDGINARFYLNGVEDTKSLPYGDLYLASSWKDVCIGCHNYWLANGGNPTTTDYFNGTIDSVRIYDKVLSQAEIQADMNKG